MNRPYIQTVRAIHELPQHEIMNHLHSYRPTHFRLEELVPRDLFTRYQSNPDFLWRMFNPYLLWTADAIREHYGVGMLCNDWLWGGRFQGRGFRPPDYESGAFFSQHKLGNALDLWPGGTVTGTQIRDDILANPGLEPFRHITCVESGVRHLHFDLRNHDRERHGILVVHP